MLFWYLYSRKIFSLNLRFCVRKSRWDIKEEEKKNKRYTEITIASDSEWRKSFVFNKIDTNLGSETVGRLVRPPNLCFLHCFAIASNLSPAIMLWFCEWSNHFCGFQYVVRMWWCETTVWRIKCKTNQMNDRMETENILYMEIKSEEVDKPFWNELLVSSNYRQFQVITFDGVCVRSDIFE